MGSDREPNIRRTRDGQGHGTSDQIPRRAIRGAVRRHLRADARELDPPGQPLLVASDVACGCAAA
jgi:hypothetical protein